MKKIFDRIRSKPILKSVVSVVCYTIFATITSYCVYGFVFREAYDLLRTFIILGPCNLIGGILIFRSIRKRNARYSKEKRS
jgi:hypothetical protein